MDEVAITCGVGRAINRILFNSDRLINIGVAILGPLVERAHGTGKLKTDMEPELLVTAPSPNLRNQAAVRRFLNATVLPVLEG